MRRGKEDHWNFLLAMMDDPKALLDHLAAVPRQPGAGYREGYEATVLALKANEAIKALEVKIDETQRHLRQMTRYAVAHFERLKKEYGRGRERRTHISGFERVAAAEVAVGLAIIIALYRAKSTINIDEFQLLKW